MRQITLQRLQVFCAVYERGSISSAARALGLSQPTASRHLRDFEAGTGLLLFTLDGGRVAPTAQADALYADSRFLGEGIDRLEARIAALRKGSGSQFTLVSVGPLMGDVVPAAILEITRALPDLGLSVDVATGAHQLRMIQSGQADMGVVIGEIATQAERSEHLGKGRFVALVPDGTSLGVDRSGSVSLEALAKVETIGLTPRGPVGRILNDALSRRGLVLSRHVTGMSLMAVPHLAQTMGMCAIVDEFTARTTHIPGLRVLPIAPALSFDVHAISPGGGRADVTAMMFVDIMRHRLGGRRRRRTAASCTT